MSGTVSDEIESQLDERRRLLIVPSRPSRLHRCSSGTQVMRCGTRDFSDSTSSGCSCISFESMLPVSDAMTRQDATTFGSESARYQGNRAKRVSDGERGRGKG
jgi:hypothetical protein